VVPNFGEYRSLLSATAVRERCHQIGKIALSGEANWFSINEDNFFRCVDLVGETCLKYYPSLDIPLHSRWRHFEIGNTDLWQFHTQNFNGEKIDLARSAVDLVFLSVLLDAGAGGDWQYHDPVTNKTLSRSEGLAAASVELFFNHVAICEKDKGWRLDAESLIELARSTLVEAFQHSPDNPLLGIEGRLELLHGLGRVLQFENEISYNRPGDMVDECLGIAQKSTPGSPVINATEILSIILNRFGEIWPSGYQQQGLNLGDCGYHSLLITDDRTNGIVPFHKLSQWLSYSLIEPLQWAGIEVANLDGLTGLPEYRNGGLFIDTGCLQALDPELLSQALSLDSEAVVEWRALTVFMLDRLAVSLRKSLELSEQKLPLCSVLQGGTWMAGRELAARLRPQAAPPLNLIIDGTIF
jgi:hypothetical protein